MRMTEYRFCFVQKLILTIFIVQQFYKLIKKLLTQTNNNHNAYQDAQSSIDNRLQIDFLSKASLIKEQYHGHWNKMDNTVEHKFVTYSEFQAEMFSSTLCPPMQMYTVAMAIPFNNGPKPLEIGSDALDIPNLVYAPNTDHFRQILWSILVRNDRAEFLRDGQFRLTTFCLLSGYHEMSSNLRQMLADGGFFIPVVREDVHCALIVTRSPNRFLQHQSENLTWHLVPLNEINPDILQTFQFVLYFLRSNVRPMEMDHHGSSDAVGSNQISPYILHEVRQRIQDIRINREPGDRESDDYARNRGIWNHFRVVIFLGRIQDDEMESGVLSSFPLTSQAVNNIRMNVEEEAIPAALFHRMNEHSVTNYGDQIGFVDLGIKSQPFCRDDPIASSENDDYNRQESLQTQAKSPRNGDLLVSSRDIKSHSSQSDFDSASKPSTQVRSCPSVSDHPLVLSRTPSAPQNVPVSSEVSPVGIPTNTIPLQKYSDQTSRAQTFTDGLLEIVPSIQRMVEAGFFYTDGNVTHTAGTSTRNSLTVPASVPNADTNSPTNSRSLSPHPDQADKKS